jgi:hypothetical protein
MSILKVVFADSMDELRTKREADPDAVAVLRNPPPAQWLIFFPGQREDRPIPIPNGGFRPPVYRHQLVKEEKKRKRKAKRKWSRPKWV